jgi:hypothetical protein
MNIPSSELKNMYSMKISKSPFVLKSTHSFTPILSHSFSPSFRNRYLHVDHFFYSLVHSLIHSCIHSLDLLINY